MGKATQIMAGQQSRLGRWVERATVVAEQLPGSALVKQRLEDAELRAMKLLKSRLDRVDPRALPSPYGQQPEQLEDEGDAESRPPLAPQAGAVSAAALLTQLLDEAGGQKPKQAREAFYQHLLRQLMPDEARMLGALSDGSMFALLHVGTGNAMGVVTHRLMENLSAVGKACQVRLADHVPDYISHLRDLRLVETADEDKSLEVKYQILESDSKVMALERETKQKLKFIRRTLKISPLGRELWNHCMPGLEEEAAG